MTFQMTRLVPGEHYYLKVLAKNAMGWSEYSEYNSIEQAETSTAPPDTPGNPRAIGAGWGYMDLEGRLSYGNGRSITHMYVQYREVQAFSKGVWSNDTEYDMSKDVTMIEEPVEVEEEKPSVDEDSNSLGGEENGEKSEKSTDKAKMLPKRKRITRMATGVIEEYKAEINTEIDVSDVMIQVSLFKGNSHSVFLSSCWFRNLLGSDLSFESALLMRIRSMNFVFVSETRPAEVTTEFLRRGKKYYSILNVTISLIKVYIWD